MTGSRNFERRYLDYNCQKTNYIKAFFDFEISNI